MTRKREEKEKEKQLSKKTRMSNSISKAESESLVLDNDPFDFLIDEPVYDYFSENSMLLHGISSSTSSSSSPYNYLSFFPWEKTLGAAVSSASSFKKKRRISKAESEPLISNQTLILCDDLLLEIFRRIPDSRSVIRCCAVCKRWRSLINSDEYKGFKQLDTFNLPYTLIFSLDEEGCQIYGYFSENSKLLHGISTSKTTSSRNKYWSFWPWKKVHIFSSFRDLLLVSPDKTFRRGRGVRRLLICNPLTKPNDLKRNEKTDSEKPTAVETGNSSSSFAEFDTLFLDIQNILEEETSKSDSFSCLPTPWSVEEITNAKNIFEQCLNVDLGNVIQLGRCFELKKSLSILLSSNAFPDNMVDEITKFLANFDQSCEQYEVAQKDLRDGQEKEKSIGELKTTMKRISSEFLPLRNQAESLDRNIDGLERQLNERKARKAKLRKSLEVLADQASTSKQALVSAEQDMQLYTLKKEPAEKVIGALDKFWNSLKVNRSLML